VALVTVTLNIALLARSARNHSSVDPDTGLPNAFGLASCVTTDDARTPSVVAVVSLTGLPEAREALGYQVATEVLRRAVEDLGQVLPDRSCIGRVEGDESSFPWGADRPGRSRRQPSSSPPTPPKTWPAWC